MARDSRPADEAVGYAAVSELDLLAAITRDFVTSPTMDETLGNAIRQTMLYMNAEAASIFLLDASGEHLVCPACAGPVDIRGLTVPAGKGIVGRTVSENRPQIVRDVSKDPHFTNCVDKKTGFTTRSILCAPLQVKGRMLGALEVINKHSGDHLFSDADQRLLQALAGIVSLAVHNARMAEALVEQERMKRELDLARQIQHSLLPAPPADGFPVAGLNLPALEVSGDFYDFFALPDGRILWGLGDVSGKGMNAALLMAKTISLFRCLGKTEHDPTRLLAILNDEIAETATHGMFVTMVAGVFTPASGAVILANAGHQPPLYRSPSGNFHEIDEASPPLGVLPGMSYEAQHFDLRGGSLYIFTDGVTEGHTADGEMLGLNGLRNLLDFHAGIPPAERLLRVARTLQQGEQRLHDDLTLLVIGA